MLHYSVTTWGRGSEKPQTRGETATNITIPLKPDAAFTEAAGERPLDLLEGLWTCALSVLLLPVHARFHQV